MYSNNHSSFIFKPNPNNQPPYFPPEEIAECEKAVVDGLSRLTNKELKAIILGLRRGRINGWVRDKNIITRLVERNGGKFTYAYQLLRMFATTPLSRSDKEQFLAYDVENMPSFRAFDYWFHQIIGSEHKTPHSQWCTPETCFFTSTTIQWCERIMRDRLPKRLLPAKKLGTIPRIFCAT